MYQYRISHLPFHSLYVLDAAGNSPYRETYSTMLFNGLSPLNGLAGTSRVVASHCRFERHFPIGNPPSVILRNFSLLQKLYPAAPLT